MILTVSLTAYAIVRHQLLDIEVVIKRTLVFAGLVGAVVTVVSFVAFLSQEVLAQFVTIPRWGANIFSAMIIAAVYGRVRDWLVDITDRFLFQKKIDYRQLLRKFTDEVMEIVNLNELLETTVDTLADTLKLESANLLLLNKNTRQYETSAARGPIELHAPIAEDTVFITFLKETHEPIGLDGELGKVNYPITVHERLELLRSRLCLPLHVHDDLIGVLCLGAKKSDEEFTAEDIDVLLPVARTLSIAISNAQLFDELLKTQAEAAQREKLAVIGTLSAGINHEICNPLGIIKAQTEAFLLDVEDGLLEGQSAEELLQRTTSILQNALKQIDRATAITQKLSNFAKPIKEASMEPVVIAAEIEEVLGLVGHDLELEKITVRREISDPLPEIQADRRQLQEVLFNLVRNAAQAIDPPGIIFVRAQASDSNVRVEIQDTGHGIPKAKLNKIWDPFFTTKDPGKGTGLGLFIVRQIVERNKGRISVESKEGEGTTFFLEFPVYKGESAAPAVI